MEGWAALTKMRAEDEPTVGHGGQRAAGSPHRVRHGLLVALTLLVGLALGVGGAWLVLRPDTPDATPSVERLALDASPAPADQPAPAAPAGHDLLPAEAATSPEAAVRGFLTAEALGEFEASHAFLSAADRETYPTPAAWQAAHADFAPITGFEIEQVEGETVITSTALQPGLDPVMGLVPARATGEWKVIEEDEGWRVAFADSTLTPNYPSDEGVLDAVRAWATARMDCRVEAQYDGTLLGDPSLAEQLCEAGGELALGEPGMLDDSERTTVLLNAFGPDIFSWTRVVPLRAPVQMQAVAAPIGDQWQVIAVLPA